jgi:hypothetical protein
VNIQWRLVPDDVGLLAIDPVTALLGERHVEVEDDTSDDEAHLRVCKAMKKC